MNRNNLFNFILFLCLFTFPYVSFGQQKAKINTTSNIYSFEFSRILTETQQSRFEERFAVEFPTINQIDFTENKMSFSFKDENLIESEKKTILIKIVQRFGFTDIEY
jgi:hypothetical protein